MKKAKHGAPLTFIYDNLYVSNDACLIWPFGRFTNGYGSIRFRGRATFAHRVMCILAHGESTPEHDDASHSCGNGHLGCINPRHLSWKSRSENLGDRLRHGTLPHGERHPSAKLTAAQVYEVKDIYARGGISHRALGRQYGVGPTAIGKIMRGEHWSRSDADLPGGA
jgi:hypothetical protein